MCKGKKLEILPALAISRPFRTMLKRGFWNHFTVSFFGPLFGYDILARVMRARRTWRRFPGAKTEPHVGFVYWVAIFVLGAARKLVARLRIPRSQRARKLAPAASTSQRPQSADWWFVPCFRGHGAPTLLGNAEPVACRLRVRNQGDAPRIPENETELEAQKEDRVAFAIC